MSTQLIAIEHRGLPTGLPANFSIGAPPPKESTAFHQRGGLGGCRTSTVGVSWKGNCYVRQETAARPVLPDLSWLRPTKWAHFGPVEDGLAFPVSDKKREQNRRRVERDLASFLSFYDKDQWGRPMSGPLPVSDGYPPRAARHNAEIVKLFDERVPQRIARGMWGKAPTYFRFTEDSERTKYSTAGDQEMLSDACLWLVLLLDRYNHIPMGRLLRNLIGAGIRNGLCDLVKSEREHHSELRTVLCISCAGTGIQANGRCADCKGKKRNKIYQQNHDFIDAYEPRVGDEDPEYVYPLQDPRLNAEQRLVASATRTAETLRVAVRTAVSRLNTDLATEVRVACQSEDKPIPRESIKALRGFLEKVEITLPRGGTTVERYARTRFRTVKVSKPVITACRNAHWWNEARARYAENHRGWPGEVAERARKWRNAIGDTPIGKPPSSLNCTPSEKPPQIYFFPLKRLISMYDKRGNQQN